MEFLKHKECAACSAALGGAVENEWYAKYFQELTETSNGCDMWPICERCWSHNFEVCEHCSWAMHDAPIFIEHSCRAQRDQALCDVCANEGHQHPLETCARCH